MKTKTYPRLGLKQEGRHCGNPNCKKRLFVVRHLYQEGLAGVVLFSSGTFEGAIAHVRYRLDSWTQSYQATLSSLYTPGT